MNPGTIEERMETFHHNDPGLFPLYIEMVFFSILIEAKIFITCRLAPPGHVIHNAVIIGLYFEDLPMIHLIDLLRGL
jgi:hypothetical protein